MAEVDRGAWRLVLVLAALNLLSYLDRQLLVALSPLIMAELGLSRADVGLLVGVAFIAVYAVFTLLAGALADRWSRPKLIAGGLAGWSAATALTGTASSFGSLALWRGLVGIGEGTLPATALSMLGDRLPAARLGLANGIFYAGIPVGFGLSFLLAGVLAPSLGWRACFFVLGAAGLLGVALVWRIEDPPRRRVAGSAVPGGLEQSVAALAGAVAERPALGVLVLGGALLVFASAASQHTIIWLVQERGFPYAHAAFVSAVMVTIGGLAGSLGIGTLTDRARRRGPGARLLAFTALGALGLAAAAAFYRLPPSSALFLPGWFLAQAWMLGWFGPFVAAVDEMAPTGMRATVIGLSILAMNLLGVATGPWVTGLVGDRWSLSAGLGWSLAPAALGLALVGLVGSRLGRAGSRP